MVNAARVFFTLNSEQKAKASLPEQCGYRPMGIEYSVNPDRPDLVESFTYSPRVKEAVQGFSGGAAILWKSMESNFARFQRLRCHSETGSARGTG